MPGRRSGSKPRAHGPEDRSISERSKPSEIDAYLATLPVDQRAALEKLRRTIRAAAPRAEECISYRLPAFRLDGRMLVWFGATAKHCALYPGTVLSEFEEELRGFETSKGTIRFQPAKPLPAVLIRKLVKARIARDAAGRRRGNSRRTRG